jgi:YqaJ-like viral recombinase domain
MEPWQSRIIASGEDRAAWLVARKDYITASDVPAILGMDSRSRAAVLRAKRGEEAREDGKIEELAMVQAGRHLERGVMSWFLADTTHVDFHPGNVLVRSPVVPYLAATPDGVMDGGPVEIKVVMPSSRPNWHEATRSRKGWPSGFDLPVALLESRREPPLPPPRRGGADRDAGDLWRTSYRYQMTQLLPALGEPEAPLKYWVQLQVQMHVLDARFGWLVSLQGGTSRYDLFYQRDLRFEAYMLARMEEFYTAWKN